MDVHTTKDTWQLWCEMDIADVLLQLELTHLADVLNGNTFSELSALARPALLTKLKDLGVAKLPERQKLATGISKAAKGQPLVAAAPPPRAPEMPMEAPPDAESDAFGRLRGAYMKDPSVCACFKRFWGKNENDTRVMNCAACGNPASDHADLGPAPEPEGDSSYEFDVSQFAVDGRTGRAGAMAGTSQAMFNRMVGAEEASPGASAAWEPPPKPKPAHELTSEVRAYRRACLVCTVSPPCYTFLWTHPTTAVPRRRRQWRCSRREPTRSRP